MVRFFSKHSSLFILNLTRQTSYLYHIRYFLLIWYRFLRNQTGQTSYLYHIRYFLLIWYKSFKSTSYPTQLLLYGVVYVKFECIQTLYLPHILRKPYSVGQFLLNLNIYKLYTCPIFCASLTPWGSFY